MEWEDWEDTNLRRRRITEDEIRKYCSGADRTPSQDREKALQMIQQKDDANPMKQKHSFLDILGSHEFADLLTDLEFWSRLVQVRNRLPILPQFSRISQEWAIKDQDEDLFCSLFYFDPELYLALDGGKLESKEAVVGAYLESFPLGVASLPKKVQQICPKSVSMALARLPLFDPTIRSVVKKNLDLSLWSNKAVVQSWAASGGCFHSNIPPEIYNDAGVKSSFLECLKKSSPQQPEFSNTPLPRLPNFFFRDKTLLLPVVQELPDYLLRLEKIEGAETLVGDWDVTIAAISSPRGLSLLYTMTGTWELAKVAERQHEGLDFWRTVAAIVKTRLESANDRNEDETTRLLGARQTLELMGIHWFD